MEFKNKTYYTALGVFSNSHGGENMSWTKYILWSRLSHLTELVSVDTMLCEELVEPDTNNDEDWNFIVTDDLYITGFYTSLDYVLSKMKARDRFNLLAVEINPSEAYDSKIIQDFEFVGYDLLDKEYGVSALSNCGGFDETFLPSELSRFGLISDYEKATDIRRRLVENNPKEHHADTNIIAIWRHKTIAR